MGNLYKEKLSELKKKENYLLFRNKINTMRGVCPAEHGVTELKTIKFSRQSKIYSFSTENLEYLEKMDLKDKKVLTVGASLDHNIVCNMMGASQIVNFDINENAYYYSLLKLKALQLFSYQEFLSFFMRGDKAFNHHSYQKVKPFLPEDCQAFFQTLYHTYKAGSILREEHLFNNLFDNKEDKIFNSYYLRSEANYLLAKSRCSNELNWIQSDILDFQTKDSYDVILLSNIADYSHKMFLGINHAEEFKLKVVNKFYNYLNLGGKIMFAYIFDYHNEDNSDKRNIINNKEYRKNLYSCNNYSEIQVKSVINGSSLDSVCFWEKNNEQ